MWIEKKATRAERRFRKYYGEEIYKIPIYVEFPELIEYTYKGTKNIICIVFRTLTFANSETPDIVELVLPRVTMFSEEEFRVFMVFAYKTMKALYPETVYKIIIS